MTTFESLPNPQEARSVGPLPCPHHYCPCRRLDASCLLSKAWLPLPLFPLPLHPPTVLVCFLYLLSASAGVPFMYRHTTNMAKRHKENKHSFVHALKIECIHMHQPHLRMHTCMHLNVYAYTNYSTNAYVHALECIVRMHQTNPRLCNAYEHVRT